MRVWGYGVEYAGFSALGFERSDLCFGNDEERIQKAFLACVEGSQKLNPTP